MAISTFTTNTSFSPVGSLSSDGLRMHVCMCLCTCACVQHWNSMKWTDMWICQRSTYFKFIPSTHTHTHTHTFSYYLTQFEDHKPMGLKLLEKCSPNTWRVFSKTYTEVMSTWRIANTANNLTENPFKIWPQNIPEHLENQTCCCRCAFWVLITTSILLTNAS